MSGRRGLLAVLSSSLPSRSSLPAGGDWGRHLGSPLTGELESSHSQVEKKIVQLLKIKKNHKFSVLTPIS